MDSALSGANISPDRSKVLNPALNETSFLVDGPASAREIRLNRIAQELENPVLIIEGQSGSGKSTTLQVLLNSGVESTVRLLPRDLRAGDAKGDRPWINENKIVGNREIDPHRPEKLLFAHHLYSGFYGFPADDFVKLYKSGQIPALIVGRAEEIPPLIEAVRNILPGVPILPLRLEVQAQILEDRLVGRPEAFVGELLERIAAIHKHHSSDRPQLSGLVQNYGLKTLLNLSGPECRAIGVHPDQLRPIDSQTLPPIFDSFVVEAKKRAAGPAKHALEPFKLDYSHPYIPAALVDVLDNRLLLEAEHLNFPVCIKGGLAVGIYLDESRPVSLDIDFTAPQSAELEAKLGMLLESVTGKSSECKDAWDKKVYHVRGFASSALSDAYGSEVELDALVLTRVQPDNCGFCYEFTYDSADHYMRRSVTLPSGRTAFIVPPEQVIIEKLAAGRGPELNKFDLYDAAGLLANIPLDTVACRKLLDFHFFDSELDKDAHRLLFADEAAPGVKEALRLLGVKSRDFLKVADRFRDELRFGLSLRDQNQEMSMDTLKRLVLADRIDSSLQRIIAQIDHPWQIGDKEVTISSRFGRERVESGVNLLRSVVHSYAAFELGKDGVIFTRRQHVPESIRTEFFSGLAGQRVRSTRRVEENARGAKQ